MAMDFFKDLNVAYKAGNLENYSGRKSKIKNQYWHQEITVLDIKSLEPENLVDIGIIGYVCDEGVKRNQGRIGARKGPKSVRNQLGKLPIHFENKNITDFGDIVCIDENLEDCQKALSKIISKLITNKVLPIAIGGGHDIAFANGCLFFTL